MSEQRTCDEFICERCGTSIYSLPPFDPPPTVCATCRFLDEYIENPIEREQLRRRMMGGEP